MRAVKGRSDNFVWGCVWAEILRKDDSEGAVMFLQNERNTLNSSRTTLSSIMGGFNQSPGRGGAKDEDARLEAEIHRYAKQGGKKDSEIFKAIVGQETLLRLMDAPAESGARSPGVGLSAEGRTDNNEILLEALECISELLTNECMMTMPQSTFPNS